MGSGKFPGSHELYPKNLNFFQTAENDRVRSFIWEMRRYGVGDVFEPEDLTELKNIPKVTKCLDQLYQLVRFNK